MNTKNIEENLEKEFHVSKFIIAYKFILGAIELVLGLGILLFGKQVLGVYQNFKNGELLEDPHDLLVNTLEKIIPYIFQHQGYIILILISIGLVKIIGSVGLLYHKHWGLDLLIGLTFLLLPFDSYNFVASPSFAKFSFLVINILIALYLVNFKPKEYFSTLKERIKS